MRQATMMMVVGFAACAPEPLDPFGTRLEPVTETGEPSPPPAGEPCGPCNSGTLDRSGNCTGALATPVEDLVANAGTLAPSTVFDDDAGQYGADFARDGDRTTSWFSAGPVDGTTQLVWTSPREDCIVGVRTRNNSEHENLAFRSGFGFASAQFRLFAAGSAIPSWEAVANLSGMPDPDVDLEVMGPDGQAGVLADRLEITFSGHEDPTCGGISEVGVSAFFE